MNNFISGLIIYACVFKTCRSEVFVTIADVDYLIMHEVGLGARGLADMLFLL